MPSKEIVSRKLNSEEAWRQIPPEEKLEMMAKAHSKGLLAAVMCVIIGATCSAALQQPVLLWAALISSPLFFQFASGKAWRAIKPATMLQYLAARSAARRYAHAARGKELNLAVLFRGELEPIYGVQQVEEKLTAMIENVWQTEVWVALFTDTLVIISERLGGASLEFAHSVSPKLSVTSNDNGGYSNDKEVYLQCRNKDDKERRYKLTSRYPAALAVFEKQYHSLVATREKTEVKKKSREISFEEGDEDRLDNLSMLDSY